MARVHLDKQGGVVLTLTQREARALGFRTLSAVIAHHHLDKQRQTGLDEPPAPSTQEDSRG